MSVHQLKTLQVSTQYTEDQLSVEYPAAYSQTLNGAFQQVCQRGILLTCYFLKTFTDSHCICFVLYTYTSSHFYSRECYYPDTFPHNL